MRAFRGPHSRGVLLSLVVATLLAGCAASQMGNMWQDRTFKTPGIKNVLVIAVRADAVRRRMWEDGFASGLAQYGVQAKRSYEIWADAVPDTQQVRDAIKANGFDGVLVNKRAPDTAQLTWQQGYSRRESVTRYDPASGAAYTTWQDVQVPATMDTTAVVNFETDLWSTIEHGRLVWSGQSRTTEAFSIQLIQYQTESIVLPELAKAKLLPPKQKK